MLPGEDAIISAKVKETKDRVDEELRELGQFDDEGAEDTDASQSANAANDKTKGSDANKDLKGQIFDQSPSGNADVDATHGNDMTMEDSRPHIASSARPKDNHDDGGEVVEGEEDTVIY